MIVKLLIDRNPYYQSGASSNRYISLIDGLAKLGVKIELLVYGGYSQKDEKLKRKKVIGNISFQYFDPYLADTLWKRRYYNYIGDRIRNKGITKKIIESIRDTDIVWTDSSLFGFQIALKIRKINPEQILFLEMSEFLDIHKYNKGNYFQKAHSDKREKFFESKAMRSYTGIALMTKTLMDYYQSNFSNIPKLLHLPMTVDLSRFEKVDDAPSEYHKPYIAFIGVMNDAKDGVNILLEAFRSVCVKFPDHKLYLVGGWNYDTPAHLEFIKVNGLQNRILWMGEVSRELIPSIIKNADLLVLPRPDSKQAQGGFPTKLGEYLASGRPVCATTVGEIPDYLEDNKSVFFAEPGSVESFTEAMSRSLSNPQNAENVGSEGRKVAERHFNSEIQAKVLYDFFKDLTKQDH